MKVPHLIAALVHSSGYERIAITGCSDRTLRRRLGEWAEAGHGPALNGLALSLAATPLPAETVSAAAR